MSYEFNEKEIDRIIKECLRMYTHVYKVIKRRNE
jgi:hypothetical protein